MLGFYVPVKRLFACKLLTTLGAEGLVTLTMVSCFYMVVHCLLTLVSLVAILKYAGYLDHWLATLPLMCLLSLK